MKVILSVEEFLATLKVGDQFWHMTSSGVTPRGIDGPLTIEGFEADKIGVRVYVNGGRRDYHYASDLTNLYHGVFLSEEDGETYFAERKLAYKTNPALIAEVTEERAWDGLLDE